MELTAKPTAVLARPAISPTPVSVPLPFFVVAHGAIGDGNLRDRNGNQGRGNANQGPRITNQGRKTEGEW